MAIALELSRSKYRLLRNSIQKGLCVCELKKILNEMEGRKIEEIEKLHEYYVDENNFKKKLETLKDNGFMFSISKERYINKRTKKEIILRDIEVNNLKWLLEEIK